jgi:hypothetical protein
MSTGHRSPITELANKAMQAMRKEGVGQRRMREEAEKEIKMQE